MVYLLTLSNKFTRQLFIRYIFTYSTYAYTRNLNWMLSLFFILDSEDKLVTVARKWNDVTWQIYVWNNCLESVYVIWLPRIRMCYMIASDPYVLYDWLVYERVLWLPRLLICLYNLPVYVSFVICLVLNECVCIVYF